MTTELRRRSVSPQRSSDGRRPDCSPGSRGARGLRVASNREQPAESAAPDPARLSRRERKLRRGSACGRWSRVVCTAARASRVPGWHSLDATVTPKSGTRSLRLFLYADGGGREPDRDRVPRDRDQPGAFGHRTWRRAARSTSEGLIPSSCALRVLGPRRGGATAVPARGGRDVCARWRVEAAGQELSELAHVRVNGYANGWRLPRGTYELTIIYGPERLARSAGASTSS